LFRNIVVVEKDTPLDIDTGLLLVTDPNPIEEERYKCGIFINLLRLMIIFSN